MNTVQSVFDGSLDWFTGMPNVSDIQFEKIAGTFESYLLKAFALQNVQQVKLSEFYRGALGSASTLNMSFHLPKNNNFCNKRSVTCFNFTSDMLKEQFFHTVEDNTGQTLADITKPLACNNLKGYVRLVDFMEGDVFQNGPCSTTFSLLRVAKGAETTNERLFFATQNKYMKTKEDTTVDSEEEKVKHFVHTLTESYIDAKNTFETVCDHQTLVS